MRNKKTVVIGGGTGLSTMLEGLKLYTDKITAIVTVADDGGSSGRLRKDFKMPPPGDVRHCIGALAQVSPVMKELINFRFSDGEMKGHSWGNITLAALNEMSESFEDAVRKFNKLMGVTGMVYPVANEPLTLSAKLADGTVIVGESIIGSARQGEGKEIQEVYITPENPKPVEGALRAIAEADIIVIGPGSLYTSIIPNLLVGGIADEIRKSKAVKLYVCNIMTQPGETDGYDAYRHLEAVEKYSYKGIADAMIVNGAGLPQSLEEAYALEDAYAVRCDGCREGVNVVRENLILVKDGKIRHNFIKLARLIMYIGNK